MMRGTAQRTFGILRDSPAITALYRFEFYLVFPVIVFKKELPVLFEESFDNREFINSVFLILRRMRIFVSPLLERDISADKVKKPADLLMLVLNILK